ncbi:MAG TPA: PKD domain-containing protein [Thermoplasmata archaeon]|nr:PKD domain-containing protein [Thermoplasmata archaeon]
MSPRSRPTRTPLFRPGLSLLTVIVLTGIVGLLLLSPVPSGHTLASAPPTPPARIGAATHPATSFGWQQITTNGSPPGTAGGGFAYDPADNYTVLFGGCVAGNYWYSVCTPTNTTWTYRNGTWTQLYPTLSPPARYYTSLTWDAALGELVLFGGNGSNGFLNDTWSFVHGTWHQLAPAVSPPARAAAYMTYDAALSQIVLFGGESFRQLTNLQSESYVGADFGDTWVFSGTTWTNVTPATSPPPRDSGSMAYDAQDGLVVLYGGFYWGGGGGNYGDTWVYNGSGNWTQQYTSPSPTGRNNGAFAMDPTLGADVLFGGHYSYSFYNDTWAYNQTFGWVQLSGSSFNGSTGSNWTSPSQRWASQLTFDAADNCLVLFGGYVGPGGYATSGFTYYNDTWSLGACGSASGSSTGNDSGHLPHGGAIPLGASAVVLSSFGHAAVTVSYKVTVSGGALPYSIQWNFGDGSYGSGTSGQTVAHRFTIAGTFAPFVTVRDGVGTVRIVQLPSVVVTPGSSATHSTAAALSPLAVYAAVGGVLALIAATAVSLRVRRRRLQRVASEGEAIVRELSDGESNNWR